MASFAPTSSAPTADDGSGGGGVAILNRIFADQRKSNGDRIFADQAIGQVVAGTACPTGVTATASVGTVTATGGAIATPVGVTATASVGIATASGGASGAATAQPAGVSAVASVGTVTATGGAAAYPAGVTAYGLVGIPLFGLTTSRQYPLAGQSQTFPLSGRQTYPLQGRT
jgi:hypothetical protein